MKLFAVLTAVAGVLLLAWRLLAEAVDERSRQDRGIAYRRWSEWERR